MFEIKKTAQDMKEELNKVIESLKNNETKILEMKSHLNQIKNTVESPSSRLEQVEDRISMLKDKIDFKEKSRRMLRKNTQELQKEYERTR
jgi:chromosome segregation ATPase